MKKIIATGFIGLFIIGCGSSGTTTTTYEARPTEPSQVNKTSIVDGDAVIIESGGDSTITTSKNADGSITVDCGEGGCGDVQVGDKIENSNDENNESSENNETNSSM
jgi:hypothetical protein